MKNPPSGRAVRHAFVFFLAAALAHPVSQANEPDWHLGGEIQINQSYDSSQDITLEQPLTLNVGTDHTVSWRGIIAGPELGAHALIKTGAGRLELWGDNQNLRKQVVLDEGSLHLAGRYALGQDWWASLYVSPGTTLSYEADAIVAAALHLQDAGPVTPGHENDPQTIQWRVDQGTATQIGPIHGVTPLIKQGAGILRLSEAAILPGSHLTVAEGGVQLESQFAGHIHVLDGSTLSGSGQAGWLAVGNGGTLAPTGRMTIYNDLTFAPDSQLRIRAWADGQHDSVHVLYGLTELDGHVLALPQGAPELWQKGIDAVIVKTGEGLGTGRFASVESIVPYLEPSLSYDSHQVTLHLTPRAPDATPGPVDPSAGWYASLGRMLADDSRFIRDGIYTHGTRQAGFWSQAFHSSGTHPDKDGERRDKFARRINGLLLGTNRDITPKWRLGLVAGASHTGAEQTVTSGTPALFNTPRPHANVDSLHVGLHAHYTTVAGTQFTAGTAYSRHRIHSRRTASTPLLQDALSSRYRAHTTQAFARIQHPLWVAPDAQTDISPFAQLAWVQTRQAGHAEQGGPLALHIHNTRSTQRYSSIGLTARHHLSLPRGAVTLTGSAAWHYTDGDQRAPLNYHFRDDIHHTAMTAYGTRTARHAWQLQLGMHAELSKKAQLSLHYAGLHSHVHQDHGVQAGLTIRW